MKKLRFFGLILVIAMLCPLFAACSSDVQATINVKFVVVDAETGEETVILEKNSYTMICPAKDMTALNAAIKVLNEYEVVFSSDDNSITMVKNYTNTSTPETDEDGNNTGKTIDDYWCLYLDGDRNQQGRMSTVVLYDGAEVVFKYERTEGYRQDTQAEVDTSEDLETEAETEEATETEDEEE